MDNITLTAGEYEFIFTDSEGCESPTIEVDMSALYDDCLQIPSLFTPNGDSQNDVWEIVGIENYPNAKIDIYNPNTIRSSLGAVFQLNVFKMNSEDIFHFLKKYDFKVYGSFIKSKIKFTEIDLKERCALVMGPEKSSISEIFMKNSDELISIPMFGNVDSLNLSVSTGIILYEAVNQRKFS